MKNNIAFIGMPGCGKSTIGSIVAEKINYKFIDMDKFIEEKEGKTVKELFKVSEDHFRAIETRACELLSNEEGIVIACGGGVIKNPQNIEFLKKNSTIVFIDRPVENIISDIQCAHRPLLANGTDILYKLYNERYDLYSGSCDYKIENTGSVDEFLSKIDSILI